MKMKVYAIYDAAVDAFLRPMFVKTEAEVIRMVKDEVNRSESPVRMHSQDYSLFELGEFDDNKGALIPLIPPKHVVSLFTFVEENPNYDLFENGPDTVRHLRDKLVEELENDSKK